MQSRLEKDAIESIRERIKVLYDDLTSLEDHFFAEQKNDQGNQMAPMVITVDELLAKIEAYITKTR